MNPHILYDCAAILVCVLLLRTWLKREWHKIRWMSAFYVALHVGPRLPRPVFHWLNDFLLKVPPL